MSDPRVVKIITGLNVREELMYGREHVEVLYRRGGPILRVAQDGKDEFVYDDEYETFIAPITRVVNSNKKDLYVAYSPEVEELLGVPIRAMQAEKASLAGYLSTAQAALARAKRRCAEAEGVVDAQAERLEDWEEWFRTANLWQRIKFLFKKGKP